MKPDQFAAIGIAATGYVIKFTENSNNTIKRNLTSPSIKCVSFVIMHTLGAPTSRPTMSKYSTMTPQKHFKRRTPSLLRNLLMDVIAIYR